MTTNASHEAASVAKYRSSALKISIATLLLIISGWGYKQFANHGAGLTTEAITVQAKHTPVEERQAWLRLARAILFAENVKPIVPPTEPLSNRSHLPVVELGRLLFFDPVLSGNQRTACASCHYPAYGLSDGLRKAVGGDGQGYGKQRAGTGTELQRNTPSLYNAAYSTIFFWDARSSSLEEQVFAPLFAEQEMNLQNVPELLRRLRSIPEYRELFARAFGANSPADGRDINLSNLARALAAYQRRLNVTDTAYDRFVGGRDEALTAEQLRGLVAFFGQGQCNACHTAPLFHDNAVAALGVPAAKDKHAPLDADLGFGVVLRRQDSFGKFKTPGLRNVSRSAPYMHNGVFDTLEEVVDFYNDGGGAGRGLQVNGQDFRIIKLELTEQQKSDLVAFLKALDDLAPQPTVPLNVPSGLPVAGAITGQLAKR